jgi:hypothetical protein
MCAFFGLITTVCIKRIKRPRSNAFWSSLPRCYPYHAMNFVKAGVGIMTVVVLYDDFKNEVLINTSLQLGCPQNKQTKFRFEPKQTETRSVSVLFGFVS